MWYLNYANLIFKNIFCSNTTQLFFYPLVWWDKIGWVKKNPIHKKNGRNMLGIFFLASCIFSIDTTCVKVEYVMILPCCIFFLSILLYHTSCSLLNQASVSIFNITFFFLGWWKNCPIFTKYDTTKKKITWRYLRVYHTRFNKCYDVNVRMRMGRAQ